MPPHYFVLIALLLTAPARADDLAAVRSEFQRAYAVAQANTPRSTPDSDALRAYAIYPYLQQLRIRRALTSSPQEINAIDQDAEDFLRGRENEPVTRDLRRQWYASLAERKQWERLLNNYRDLNDAALRCHALTARIALQRLDTVQATALDLWSKASASLPACEPIFTWLKSQQFLTPALIERRARLALSVGNADFARQLIAGLPSELAAPLITWAEFIEQPQKSIAAASNARAKQVIEPAALLDGWIRLARADQDEAMRLYKPLVRAQQLSKEVASRFALELALALSWNRRAEALNYFAKVSAGDIDERAAEWYARAAIWASDWQRTTKVIAAMPDALRKKTSWRYWAARAAEQLGEGRAARNQYTLLLGDDNYYAALAAARLQQPYAPRPESLMIDTEQIAHIEQLPTFLRARELLFTGLRTDAYEEWREGYGKLAVDARVQSIALAAHWGWHDQAITTAAQLSVFNDYALLYPHPFDNEINAAATLTTLPAALLYATLRQESLYRVDALSGAGAQGLMQLLPSTAKRTARRWQLPPPTDLLQPAINIPIGAAVLRDFYKNFGAQTAVALAAYNAGPGAAARWLTPQPKAADVWIENIPFNETRTYVQRVLWHSVVFGWLATAMPQDTTAWLSDIRKTS